VEAGSTMIYRARAPVETQAVTPEELGVEREVVTLTVAGEEHAVDARSVVLGRSRECDVRVDDPNASRRHAELRQEGATYWLIDLDSTNGTQLNGRKVTRAKLSDGDRIRLGDTEIVFGRSLP
jgi:pSer/pThr/pTyr-binding forkhead associated (FHA) protein